MAKADLHVVVEGALKLAHTDRRLRQAAEVGLRKELRKGLKDAASPTMRELRSAVRKVQVTPDPPAKIKKDVPHRPLRRTVAAALRLRMRPTVGLVRIEVSPRAFPKNSTTNPETLPKYLDATLRTRSNNYWRWRHPVFWPGPISTAPPRRVVEQHGQPWFFVTIDKRRPQMRREMFQAIDRVADQITR